MEDKKMESVKIKIIGKAELEPKISDNGSVEL
jgi:hypothetical protein